MKSNAIVLQLLDYAMSKLANKTYPQILDQAEKTCQRHIIVYFMKRKYAIMSLASLLCFLLGLVFVGKSCWLIWALHSLIVVRQEH